MIASVVQRAGDRLLALFVPKLDHPARADDCQTEYYCSGYTKYRHTCCLHANGTVTCGWSYFVCHCGALSPDCCC
jgi:hypothetical protein